MKTCYGTEKELLEIAKIMCASLQLLRQPKADNVSDTDYNYKQGVGKTKVVRSPIPQLRAWGYG